MEKNLQDFLDKLYFKESNTSLCSESYRGTIYSNATKFDSPEETDNAAYPSENIYCPNHNMNYLFERISQNCQNVFEKPSSNKSCSTSCQWSTCNNPGSLKTKSSSLHKKNSDRKETTLMKFYIPIEEHDNDENFCTKHGIEIRYFCTQIPKEKKSKKTGTPNIRKPNVPQKKDSSFKKLFNSREILNILKHPELFKCMYEGKGNDSDDFPGSLNDEDMTNIRTEVEREPAPSISESSISHLRLKKSLDHLITDSIDFIRGIREVSSFSKKTEEKNVSDSEPPASKQSHLVTKPKKGEMVSKLCQQFEQSSIFKRPEEKSVKGSNFQMSEKTKEKIIELFKSKQDSKSLNFLDEGMRKWFGLNENFSQC